jgi:hypothetical protein
MGADREVRVTTLECIFKRLFCVDLDTPVQRVCGCGRSGKGRQTIRLAHPKPKADIKIVNAEAP